MPASSDIGAHGRPASRWGVLIAVGAGTFMSALDGSVVNTVLPVVTEAFGVGVATAEWVVTVYLLIVSGMLLTVGRLGDLRGHRSVYIGGFAVFINGSALCGGAPTAITLIVFRAIQALGAAMLFANSPAILTACFPANQRGRALGLQASMAYLGLSVGPALGGWLATTWGWRSVFYVNVPVGLAALLLSLRFVPGDAVVDRADRFDLAGATTFMLGLTALLLGLNQGHAWGWQSPAILASFGAAALLLGCFLGIERRLRAPMLDLTLFEKRTFTAATASAVLNYVGVFSTAFLLPFYLIHGRGLSPDHAGLWLTALPLTMAVTAPFSGAVSDRIGSRLPATTGMVILAGGLFLLSRLGRNTPLGLVAVGLVVTGLGTSLFGSPNSNALMGAAPPDRQGIAAGVLACARNVGMVLGIGLAGAVFTTALATGPESFFDGVADAFVAAGVAALAGALVSAIR